MNSASDESRAAIERLRNWPRLALGNFPTPLERSPRLSRSCGVELLIKREDLAGLCLGGNKVRKLELVLGAPDAQRADVLLTAGGRQSNHARETSAAAARLGKHAVLLLRGSSSEPPVGNELVSRALGAEVVDLGEAPIDEMGLALELKARDYQRTGRSAFVVPPAAAGAAGAAAWMLGAIELTDQLAEMSVKLDAIVMAAGSGSTVTGLALGLALLGSSVPVYGVSVGRDSEDLRARTQLLADQTGAALSLSSPLVERGVRLLRFDIRERGDGYSIATDGGRRAVIDAAHEAGILLDLTYTGKAFAGLRRLISEGTIPRGSTVLFIHSGGSADLLNRGAELFAA